MRTIIGWLRASLACVLIWCLMAPACSVPDDPNWDRSVLWVDQIPKDQRRLFVRWMGNQRARRFLRGKDASTKIASLKCKKRPRIPVTIADMIECVNADEHNDWLTCVDDIIARKAQEVGISDKEFEDCDFELSPGYTLSALQGMGLLPHILDDDEQERRKIDEEIVMELLLSTAPPAWYLAMVAAAAAGIGLPAGLALPRLCAQTGPNHWSCPSSPLYPPGQTPQPTGGDK